MPDPTNLNFAGRYAMNIAKDGPLAIYEVTPDVEAMKVGTNHVIPAPPHPSVIDDPLRWQFFALPSTHTTTKSNAYYIKSIVDPMADWPSATGIPMIYGLPNKTRFSFLNRDANVGEAPIPIIQIPSFGFGQSNSDRAKSIEFWMETDPYPHPVNVNLFETDIATLSYSMQENYHYTLTNPTGFEMQPIGVVSPDPDSGVIGLNNTSITFIKDKPVLASQRTYTFSVSARNYSASPADVVVTIELQQQRINDTPIVKSYTKTFTLPVSNSWVVNNVQFVAHELMNYPEAQVTISTNALVRLSMLGMWVGSGGSWQPPGTDCESDIEFFSTSAPTTVLAIGGKVGSAVELLADAEYLYLRSGDQIGSYYVGRWGGQMYLVLVDEGTRVSLYLDTVKIITIAISDVAVSGVSGEYGLFYISPLFKYIDIATIAVYPDQLSVDLMKLHYIFGSGPKYEDVVNRTSIYKAYVADGSGTTFSGKVMFPDLNSFSLGTFDGLVVDGQTLTLPKYELPSFINTVPENVIFTVSSASDYSLLHFRVPEDSFMQLDPLNSIDRDIEYVFIDVASLVATNQVGGPRKQICSVTSDSAEYAIIFYLEVDSPNNVKVTGVIQYQDNTEREVYSDTIPQSDFSLVFNMSELRYYDDYEVSVLCNGDPVFTFNSESNLRSISCCTEKNARANGVLTLDESLPAISIEGHYDAFGNDTRNLLQKSTYSVYPNVAIIDGSDRVFLDIAANGYWKASIPLANLAWKGDGDNDINFIVYSDSNRAPQLISGVRSDRQTYAEVATYVDTRSQFWANKNKYSAAQTLFGSLTYDEVGVETTFTIPTLGRFSNPGISTFVTLDSRTRFPYKVYETLKTVKASPSMFIDFKTAPESIIDHKWEIFNDFSIRVGQIDVDKYQLGYGVHMSSPSLILQRPVMRNARFFGIGTGTDAANSVSVGRGSVIAVGNDGSIGVNGKFSMHVPTEVLPSIQQKKNHGFYSHGYSETDAYGHLNYFLSYDDPVGAVTFYGMWRNEAFVSDGNVSPELNEGIGVIAYVSNTGVSVSSRLDVITQISPLMNTAIVQAENPEMSVYVDGDANGIIYANRWHLIHIELPEINSFLRFVQTNPNIIVNYVCSHYRRVDPKILYQSRTGTPSIYMSEQQELVLPDARGRFIVRSFDVDVNPYSFDL